MSLETIMAILAATAELSGYSVADVISRVRKPEKRLASLNLVRLLSIFDDDNDPLTGVWALNRWDYNSKVHSGYLVSGSLAILYKVPRGELWKGTLFLKYCRKHSDKGWIARRRGYLIEGAYNIEIKKKGKSSYEGTSTMTYRNPKVEVMGSGEFSNIRVGKGKLVCEFFNTNIQGEADVVFHQRRRWKEIDLTAL